MDDNWLAGELAYTDSQIKRFGPDERDDADVPHDQQHGSQMPGGYGTASFVLPRPPSLRADDAALFSSYRAYGPHGTAYEGLVTGMPQVGVNEIRIECEGWVSILDKDQTFHPLIVDRDFSRWQTSPSRQRAIVLAAAGYTPIDASVVWDSAQSALGQTITGDWLVGQMSEAFYDAGSRHIARLCYSGEKTGTVSAAAWHASANLCTGSVGPGGASVMTGLASDSSGELLPSGLPSNGTVNALNQSPPRRYAFVQFYIGLPGGNAGEAYTIRWPVLAIISDHGLTPRGTNSATTAQGYYASDIIGWMLSGTGLNYTLGDSIEPSTLVIPHFSPAEPGTRRQAIENLTAIGGATFVPNDWGVYDSPSGPEFFWRTPGTYGRTWRVRKDQIATPISEGPHSTDRCTGMMISYTDGAQVTYSVGPPGSGADFETAQLLDTNPDNPAARIPGGVTRHETVGITDQNGAVGIGKVLMADANRIDWQGTIELVGDVPDAAGNTYPACMVRAGDRILVEDDEYPTERPIVSTNYNHSDLKVTVDIGAPPATGPVLLAQLAAATDLA